jgi:hypothetical protein
MVWTWKVITLFHIDINIYSFFDPILRSIVIPFYHYLIPFLISFILFSFISFYVVLLVSILFFFCYILFLFFSFYFILLPYILSSISLSFFIFYYFILSFVSLSHLIFSTISSHPLFPLFYSIPIFSLPPVDMCSLVTTDSAIEETVRTVLDPFGGSKWLKLSENKGKINSIIIVF